MDLSGLSKVVLHLSLIKNVGPATIEKLVQKLSVNNLKDIYNFSVLDFINLGGHGQAGVSSKLAQSIVSGLKDTDILNKELELIYKYKIKVVSIFDKDYPEELKHIYLPPPILYIKGNLLSSFDKKIAIVGSRKADSYGHKVVKSLVSDLVLYDWTIVSGGALGIDSIAHSKAVKLSGKTIAVLGSGLLKPYPAVNKSLFRDIVNSGGTVISSFALNTEPHPGNFPARNRIISGLSKGCIVAQAARKSGALITASYALEQGREVFAVPGDVFNSLSAGCNYLISQGATLINSATDLLDYLGVDTKLKVNSAGFKFRQGSDEQIFKSTTNKTLSLEKAEVKLPETPEDKILFYAKSEISVDELLIKTKLDQEKLNEILWDLQINGQIEQSFAGLWKRV